MFQTGTQVDLINGFIQRGLDRATVTVLPLKTAQTNYEKAADTLHSKIMSVKGIIEKEEQKAAAEQRRLGDAIAIADQQIKAAESELETVFKSNDDKKGVEIESKIGFFERKKKALLGEKDTVRPFSNGGKAAMKVALQAVQTAQSQYEKARMDYYFSVDKELIEKGIELLTDISNRHFENVSDIINSQTVRDTFIYDSELMKMNLLGSDLVNLILYGGK